MQDSPDVFIEKTQSVIIPTRDSNEFDPITGSGVTTDRYRAENRVVLEVNRTQHRDYSVSAYTNMRDKLYAQHASNMITPITYRPSLDHTVLKDYLDTKGVQGVYVVERYTIPGISNTEYQEFLDYYQRTLGISYDEHTVNAIRTTISAPVTKRGGLRECEFRIITFIDAAKIRDNQYTYLKGSGIMVVHGGPNNDLHHPFSPAYLEHSLCNPVNEDASITIDVSIIDNDNKPYYCMLGSSVKTVRPTKTKKATVLPNGGTVVIRRGSDIIDEQFFPLEEFEENGFYRNKELCRMGGDSKLALEHKKLDVELKKVREANAKLELEKEARERIFELDMKKRKTEYELFVASKTIELTTMAAKQTIDIRNKVLDMKITKIKHGLDMIKIAEESIRAKELHNYKMIDAGIRLLTTGFKLF